MSNINTVVQNNKQVHFGGAVDINCDIEVSTGVGNFLVHKEVLQELVSIQKQLGGKIWFAVAGGYIRDQLLGVKVSDVDIFATAYPEVVRQHCDYEATMIDRRSDMYGDIVESFSFRKGVFNLVATNPDKSLRERVSNFTCDVSSFGAYFFANSEGIYFKGVDSLMGEESFRSKTLTIKVNNLSISDLRYGKKLISRPCFEGWYVCDPITNDVVTISNGSVPSYSFFSLTVEQLEHIKEIADRTETVNDPDSFAYPYNPTAVQLTCDKLGLVDCDVAICRAYLKGMIDSDGNVEDFVYYSDLVDVVQSKTKFVSDPVYDVVWEAAKHVTATPNTTLKGWDILSYMSRDVADMFVAGYHRKAILRSGSIPAILFTLGFKGDYTFNLDNDVCTVLSEFLNEDEMLDFSGVKPKFCSDFDNVLHYIHALYYSKYVGSAVKYLSQYHRTHTVPMVKIPESHAAAVVKSMTLMGSLTVLQDTPIEWSRDKSAKQCILSAIEKAYPQLPALMVLENPSMIEAVDILKELGDASEYAHEVYGPFSTEEGYTLEALPKSDIRNLVLGDLTGCCQTLGGAAEEVCTLGWKDKHSINYVVKSPSGKVLAHTWVWTDEFGNFILDSVEGRGSIEPSIVAKLITQLVEAIGADNCYLSTTFYGMTRDIASLLEGRLTKVKMNTRASIKPKRYILDAYNNEIYCFGKAVNMPKEAPKPVVLPFTNPNLLPW